MDSLPLSIYLDHFFLNIQRIMEDDLCEHRSWISKNCTFGCLEFAIRRRRSATWLFDTFRPHFEATWSHSHDAMCSTSRHLSNETFSGQASKIWARTSFRQISLQLRPILQGRLRPCYLLPRLIANRLATWWPTTQKTHLSTTGTQWTQPRRTKTCVWQSIWKRIINELHFLLYDSTGS